MVLKIPTFTSVTEVSRETASKQTFPGEMTHWLCGFQSLLNSVFGFPNLRALVSLGGQHKSVFPSCLVKEFNPFTTFASVNSHYFDLKNKDKKRN